MGQNHLSSTRRYDPEAIAKYYYYRLWLVMWRFLVIFFSFTSFVLGILWDKWRYKKVEDTPERATQLRKILTNLGPTFIKVGQALSTRPDLIRKDFLEELTKLQDQLPAFDNQIAISIIETELGQNINDIYREVSPRPVAAASLGQVYKARLQSGESVAIKVQRPNLLPIITLDLFLMRWGASWLSPWLPLNLGHDLSLIVDEFGTKLFEEIDYINEGHNAERFATYFADDPSVKVPSIYWHYTTTNVLTLEWIDGLKLLDTKQIQGAGLNTDTLITAGVTSGLRQLLEFGFFHADPHPGNLFALTDGRMAYIDFGMMDQLEQDIKETLVDSVIHLINKDYQELAKDFVKLGFLAPDADIQPIIPALEMVLGNIMGEKVKDFNFKTITDKFSELMYEYPFRVPAKFALIIRSLVTEEGLALSLNPNFKIVDVAYPYVARRLLKGESPGLRRRLIEVLFKDGKFQWQRLENLIGIARTDQNFDILPTAQLGLQYLLSEEGEFLRKQLILAIIEDDRIHTEEVSRLWDLIQDDLQPSRLFNFALGALAEFSTQRAAAILPSVMATTNSQAKN
ncbi:ABC-1 [Trichodesmium erythraeum IMS101]|uniref:ABC-1 n=1 Tax=Trichodesmium erythraeum (strain IMS101) TaxID=203124 RepID=Q111V6_TRIEI|nr:AarF/ABC1/UbiB kinase family protein [Trichodesmium sp. ALOHA_ZT_67]MDE5096702.1 AarF/ABC1/UbiB kinase family protein [Trichodesmium sp. St11_bin5]MDT9340334.1 AarF/ABC1/UbiB kinase family protein [Trichodesmium erythraeum 21-75]